MPSKVETIIPSKKTSNTYREILQEKKGVRWFGVGFLSMTIRNLSPIGVVQWKLLPKSNGCFTDFLTADLAPGTKNIDQRDAGGLEL